MDLSIKLAKDIKIETTKFFTDFDQEMKTEKYSIVWNVDEVSIFFETKTNDTLEIKGKKHVIIFSTGKKKERCTVLLGIASNGEKLPPVLIF